MTTVTDRAAAAVARLEGLSDEQLYEQLGLRVRQMNANPVMAGYFEPPEAFATPMGMTVTDLVGLGRRTFVRFSKMGFDVICGAGVDATQAGHLERLVSSMGTNVTAVTAIVATMLTSAAIAPVVAPLLAALIVGKIAPKTLDDLCLNWKARIDGKPPAAPSGAPAAG